MCLLALTTHHCFTSCLCLFLQGDFEMIIQCYKRKCNSPDLLIRFVFIEKIVMSEYHMVAICHLQKTSMWSITVSFCRSNLVYIYLQLLFRSKAVQFILKSCIPLFAGIIVRQTEMPQTGEVEKHCQDQQKSL